MHNKRNLLFDDRFSVWILLVLLSTFLLSVFVSSPIALATERKINISHSYFQNSPTAKVLKSYIIDDDGFIIDGPRQGSQEPIDYTDLMTDEAILDFFTRLVFACSYSSGECEDNDLYFRKWKGKDLKIYMGSEGGIANENESEIVVDAFEKIYSLANKNIRVVNEVRTSSINILVGTEEYFYKMNRRIDRAWYFDALVDLFLENLRSKKIREDYYKGFHSYPKLCFAGVIGFDNKFKGYISISNLYVHPQHLSECIDQLAFSSLGFFPDNLAISSLAVRDGSYRIPTKLDKLLIEIVTSNSLQTNISINEAVPIVQSIIENSRF